METFGLSKGVAPDAEGVRAALDENDTKLMNVAQAMANTVRGALNDNAAKLAKVDQRLRSSINGHLRRNNALLAPVAQAMSSTVTNMLDQNQASINVIASHPAIQDAVKEVPPVPAYGGTVPQLAPPPNSPPAAAPSPSPAGGVGAHPHCPDLALPPGWVPLTSTSVIPPNTPWPAWTAIFDTGAKILFVDFSKRSGAPLPCAASIGTIGVTELPSWQTQYQIYILPYSLSSNPIAPPALNGAFAGGKNWGVAELWVSCRQSMAALVPSPTAEDRLSLEQQGYVQDRRYGELGFPGPNEAYQWLSARQAEISSDCATLTSGTLTVP